MDTAESESLNDAVYDSLGDRRRRYAVHYLKQRAEPVSVRDLAEQVAAWENDKAVAELDSQERKRVYIALYQSHLPTMDEQGLVAYDDESGTVELTDELESADIYLEIVPEADIPWNLYYVGLSAANAVLLTLAWLGVEPFTRLPELGWAVIVLVTFAVSAFVQTYTSARTRFGDEGPPPGVRDDS